MQKFGSVFGLIIVLASYVAYESVFIVPEGSQAVLLQFGKVVKAEGKEPGYQEAGLYFKLPFVQNVRYFERRILNWDGSPTEVPTREKRNIIVDTTARWRIQSPVLFLEKLQDETSASTKIRSWINSATREVISSHDLVEAVRSSNEIIEQIEEAKTATANSAVSEAEKEILTELQPIPEGSGRQDLSRKIIELAAANMAPSGLELIDVQIKRVSLTKEVEDEVFNRMISERTRIAEKLRSEGKGEKARILGLKDKELLEIQSGAYKTVQEIKGSAEAEAIKIYAEAIKEEPEFYSFFRTLEVYRNGLRDDSKIILSGDAKFLKLLREGGN